MILQYFLFVIFCINSFIIGELILPIHLGQVNDDYDTTEPHDEVKLDDFFWTGSGDGPPEYLKKLHTGLNKGKDVIVKTETVIATVYLSNDNDPNSICYDCIQNSKNDKFNYTIVDRRYWLLTVLSGYFHPPEYAILEDKLAKLYRLAFTRQQFRHLGIVNHISENITELLRKRRNVQQQYMEPKQNYQNKQILIPTLENFDESVEILEDERNKIVKSVLLPYSSTEKQSILNVNENSDSISNLQENIKDLRSKKTDFHDRQIRVVIHNVTLIKEDDVQNWMENRYEDENDRRNELPFANQTELIYTVFVDGKPVLATAAADDVKLLSDNEITNILEYTAFMKAEPYLKEPQATPLVPASNKNSTSLFATITHNSVLLIVSSIIILLLLLLIIVLILMIRVKCKRNEEIKRLSGHQRLLLEHQKSQEQFPEVTTVHERGSHQNFGYEQEYPPQAKADYNHKKLQTISTDFPVPSKDTRPNSTETTVTSDSSIYCPINKPQLDLQTMLDEKASKLFEKKYRSSHIQNESKTESLETTATFHHKKRDKKTKHKHKRRYLSENRVGSIEEVQNQFSDTSISSDSLSDTFRSNYDRVGRNEAYNPNNNYNRNKILQNRIFTDKVIYDTVNEGICTPKEAINHEMMKKIKFGDKSSESGGSIGSFLSMASMKSFPKTVLPEPLHRVLEPITVTHYDHYDHSIPRSSSKIKTTENTPRDDKKDILVSAMKKSHSDSQDPGVLGPVVWEIHKKTTKDNKQQIGEKSSGYEPAASRIRFEGLLESAIQLYSNPENVSLPSTASAQNTLSRPKENRGKSAIVTRNLPHTPRTNPNITTRPLTADPISNVSYYVQTQPPTPNEKAWDSRISSPLIRPLSAGPFHRPQTPIVDVTRVLVSQSTDKNDLSAAPLIEAIQNELKKFKRNSSQQ